MKRFLAILSLLILVSVPALAQKKVGIVFDAGGKNDRSFNQSAWEGALRAQKELGILLKDAEPGDTSGVEEAMRAFASEGYDLVFGIGFANAPYIEKVAKEFPNLNFAIVDMVVDLPNVSSLVFNEHEGSFLVGMIAAMRSRKVNGKRTIGFIGGMEIDLIKKFEQGYVQGAQTVYPGIEVIINYVGNTPTAWNDPTKAKEIANAQMGKGAKVIYAAAGGSGNGLFDAIKEKNGKGNCYRRIKKCVYAIGVDSNQNYIVPGQILTSMLKRVDVSVFSTIKALTEGNLKGGFRVFGLENDGVGYALDKYNGKLINKTMKKVVEQYKAKIINGEIVVRDKRLE
jgi:basic membrane protein A and related proteins